jgi:anti-sigma factor RsiW
MNCTEVRMNLLARRRGTLDRAVAAGVDAHLAECEACRREDAADRALTTALEENLLKRRAPESLRRAVEAQLKAPVQGARPHSSPASESAASPRPAPSAWRRRAPLVGSFVAAAALAAAVLLYGAPRQGSGMVTEAVNDHLRILYSEHPVEVESGGVHQVKPWFEGRVDFAPTVAFGGDDDFPLQGGAIAYFVDRKAAAYVYKRRLHLITLFVYRADGLPWPAAPPLALGHVRAMEQTTRGFHVLLWRDADLGYALVSDLDPRELEALAGKIAGP